MMTLTGDQTGTVNFYFKEDFYLQFFEFFGACMLTLHSSVCDIARPVAGKCHLLWKSCCFSAARVYTVLPLLLTRVVRGA